MTRTVTLRHFADPGHGWVRIRRSRLVRLGIADKISPYSYQRGPSVFVEEDGDLSTLVEALKARGAAVKFRSTHTNRQSKIRGYESYQVI